MAEGGMKFIRVNGRVVPIKGKGAAGPKKPLKKDSPAYRRKTDDLIRKHDAQVGPGETKFTVAALGSLAGVLLTKGKTRAALAGAGVASLVGLIRKGKQNEEKMEVSRAKDYVRATGATEYGERPFSKKSKKSKLKGTSV